MRRLLFRKISNEQNSLFPGQRRREHKVQHKCTECLKGRYLETSPAGALGEVNIPASKYVASLSLLINDANYIIWFYNSYEKSEILTSSVTHEIFSNIFLEIFFFTFSWSLLPYIHPVKSLLNMSVYPFTEVSFAAASVLDQLPSKLTLLFALTRRP